MKALTPLILSIAMSTLSAQEIRKFSFAVIGDQPYSPVNGDRQVYPSPPYDRLIASVNEDRKVDFTVHIGDIKAGNTRCEDEIYWKNKEYFNTFRRPLIFAPGDNEWTDCHRENNGIFNPIERLAFLRSVFYEGDMSLGRRKMKVKRQSEDANFALYRENVIWTMGPVVFVVLNMPGSNNNRGRLTGEYPDTTDAEYGPRNAANLAWLDTAFQMAAADAAIKGVAIFAQANPFDRFLEVTTPPYAVSGYQDFITSLRQKAQSSGKKVLYVGGDTHYARVDRPLTTLYPGVNQVSTAGVRIQNFTRVEVFGQTDVHWTRIDVDAGNPDVFEFKLVTAPGN